MVSLSIILPVFNVEKYIHTCIESIYNQGMNDKCFEVIIVNDGTKDNSIGVIQDIISQHQNITVLEQENQGSWVARNTGMSIASGEYILFLDPDDFLIDNSLIPLLDKALETKADILLADYLTLNDEEIERSKDTPFMQEPFTIKEKTGEQLFLEDLNPHHCYIWRSLFRKDYLLGNNLTFNTEFYYQDVPFLHECYIKAKRCLRVSWLLTIYRIGHESATFSFNIKKAKSFCIAIAKTWELTHDERLSKKALQRLQNDVFVSFKVLNCTVSHSFEKSNERYEIIDYLHHNAPTLCFKNGIKQRITTFLYRNTPHIYIQLRYLYGIVAEDVILPYCHHMIRRLK